MEYTKQDDTTMKATTSTVVTYNLDDLYAQLKSVDDSLASIDSQRANIAAPRQGIQDLIDQARALGCKTSQEISDEQTAQENNQG